MLLEDLGLAKRGEAAARVRAGHFNRDGAMPLNTHGGLLSYGHCGVGGAMAHLVETHLQMTGRAGNRQVRDASVALLAWRRRRAVVPCQHVPGAGVMNKPADWTSGSRSDPLSILRRVREGAIFPPRLLRGLRLDRTCGEAREREGHRLRDFGRDARRDAGDPRACALQYRAGRYGRGLSHDGAWRQRSCRSATSSRAFRPSPALVPYFEKVNEVLEKRRIRLVTVAFRLEID